MEQLEKLRQQQELAEKLGVNIAVQRADWKKEAETHKSRIHTEFVSQRNFLAEEEQRQLQKLEEDESGQRK